MRDAGPDGPVVMLNLLKFREQANYPAGSPHAPCSGAEAYRRYQTAFVENVGDVSRAEVVWEGKIDRPFIGDASQDWDKCLLVRYPSRQHFLAMMANASIASADATRAQRHPLEMQARTPRAGRQSLSLAADRCPGDVIAGNGDDPTKGARSGARAASYLKVRTGMATGGGDASSARSGCFASPSSVAGAPSSATAPHAFYYACDEAISSGAWCAVVRKSVLFAAGQFNERTSPCSSSTAFRR